MRNSLKYSAILAIMVLFNQSFQAQTYERVIGGDLEDRVFTVVSAGNGFILGGETSSYELQDKDAFLLKMNESGKMDWFKTYGGYGVENINDITFLPSGGYVAVGESYEGKGKKESTFVLKADAQGNMLWNKKVKEGDREVEGFSIVATPDGGFVIVGSIKTSEMVSNIFAPMKIEKENVYLLKIDQSGNKVWSAALGVDDVGTTSKGRRIITARDGGFLIVGHVHKTTDDKQTDICLLKINQKGKKEWSKIYKSKGQHGETAASIVAAESGGYLISGNTFHSELKRSDLFLLKVSEQGKQEWIRTYGGNGNEIGNGLTKVEGGVLLYGTTRSFSEGLDDGLLVKTNEEGKAYWAKSYGAKGYENITSAIVNEKGYLLAGFTLGFGAKGPDMYVVQTNFKGESNCNSKSISSLQIKNQSNNYEEEEMRLGWNYLPVDNDKSQVDLVKLTTRDHPVSPKHLCD